MTGWRLLNEGETIRPYFDEWLTVDGRWEMVLTGGVVESGQYRRRIDPTDDIQHPWREVEIGETLQPGDQWYSRIDSAWRDVDYDIGRVVISSFSPYRRRVEVKP